MKKFFLLGLFIAVSNLHAQISFDVLGQYQINYFDMPTNYFSFGPTAITGEQINQPPRSEIIGIKYNFLPSAGFSFGMRMNIPLMQNFALEVGGQVRKYTSIYEATYKKRNSNGSVTTESINFYHSSYSKADSNIFIGDVVIPGIEDVPQLIVFIPIGFSYKIFPKMELGIQFSTGFTLSQREGNSSIDLISSEKINNREVKTWKYKHEYKKIKLFKQPVFHLSLEGRYFLCNNVFANASAGFMLSDLIQIPKRSSNSSFDFTSKPLSIGVGIGYRF